VWVSELVSVREWVVRMCEWVSKCVFEWLNSGNTNFISNET